MSDGQVERLLAAVWGSRQGYAFLPYKDTTEERRWHEVPGLFWTGSNLPSLEDHKSDLYFCPVLFKENKRQKEFALATNILWADLDPVHPNDCRLKPSIAWESSPGRYQALWFLTVEVSAEEASQLSKRIAYADGGDRSGWDVTQVLRIPGTHNYKYDSAPEVQLLWAKRNAYSVDEIMAAYPQIEEEHEKSNGVSSSLSLGLGGAPKDWPDVDEQTIQAAIQSLKLGLRKRITRDPAGADRSKEIQLLARDLIQAGVFPEVAVHILQRSTFNKYAGRRTEHTDLLRHVQQAQEIVEVRKQKKSQPSEPIEQMEVHTWGNFMQIPTKLEWLVDEAWVDQSVGFISGRSKSYKTWIALDLALSIVSGKAFLGRYEVRRTGPVLLIQEEDPSSVLQERLRLIGKSKEMLPTATVVDEIVQITYPDFPLHIINLQGFNLGSDDKISQVRRLIAEINPVMVILDPLIVMLGSVDENRATEVATLLQVVKMWREEFGCSVVIVHHWNKTKTEDGERFAQHMYGSFAFHAWLESALHVMPVIEEEQERIDSVIIEKEFKAAPSGRSLKLKFKIDTIEKYTYEVDFEDSKSMNATEQSLYDAISESSFTGLTTPELVAITGHARARVSEYLNRLVRFKMVVVSAGGGRGKSSRYWLPDNRPAEEK
jgi:RecA-family ATPase